MYKACFSRIAHHELASIFERSEDCHNISKFLESEIDGNQIESLMQFEECVNGLLISRIVALRQF